MFLREHGRGRVLRPRVHRGLGQDLPGGLPDISSLPQAGNLQSQIAQGQNLITTAQSAVSGIASGNPNAQAIAALLSQGVTMANNLTSSSSLGTIVRDIMTIGTATAAGACAGPWGAAVGAIVSSLEVLIQALFGSGGGWVTYCAGEPTQGASRLYNLVKQWGSMSLHMGQLSGNVMGWTFYDYIARKYPPSGTGKSMQTDLWNEVAQTVWNAGKQGNGPNNSTQLTIGPWNNMGYAGTQMWPNPSKAAEAYFASNYNSYGPCSSSSDQPFAARCVVWPGNYTGPAGVEDQSGSMSDEAAYMKIVQPLATPVFWGWGEPGSPDQPGLINDVENNEFFGKTNKNITDFYNIWKGDTTPIVNNAGEQLSVQDIMTYAEANRPSPMFYASDLYVLQTAGRDQIFCNCDVMSGVATVFGQLAAGASCQSIISELLMQQSILQSLDGKVSPLFRLLVEEYLAKATAERETATLAAANNPPAGWSTGAKVALGAAVLGVGGLLGYSAYKKESPLVVIQGLKSSIRSRI
jgi:hypothetical protein